MEDDNDILNEDYIVKAIILNGGISGTPAVHVGAAALFGKRALQKINLKINTEARETHEVCWQEDFVLLTNSSNISDPGIIRQAKLLNDENNDLFFSVVSIFKSVKPALWLKEGGDEKPGVAPISVIYSKATSYLAALQQPGISQNIPAQI